MKVVIIAIELGNCYLKAAFTTFSATAQSVQAMIVGRLLAGIGIGISSAIVPLYISEVFFLTLKKKKFFTFDF